MKGIRLVPAWLPLAAMLALTSPAWAAAPPAPAVSVNAGVKQLNFLWNRVAGATRYELWFLAGTGGTWVKYAEVPRWRSSLAVNISAHFILWNEARYQVKACNTSGCGASALLGVSHLMQQTVGIFRLPSDSTLAEFGRATDISEDGTTLAATAGPAVAVFRKSPTGWAHEAELEGDPLPVIVYPPDPAVSISGNGNVIALGVDGEIRPGAEPEAEGRTGAVYLFRRTGSGWAREQKLSFPASLAEDAFGWHVDLDESGTVLAAWRRFGDPPFPDPGAWRHQGVVEIFRYSGGAWVHENSIRKLNDSCELMKLSGDGNTLVYTCGQFVEVATAPSWQRVARLPNPNFRANEYIPNPRSIAVSHDGRSFAVRSVSYDSENVESDVAVNVYRLGAAGWAREASVTPGTWVRPSFDANDYGLGVDMSRDGRFLAVSATDDPAAGAGAVYPPIVFGDGYRGAVYVYERKSSGWRLRQFIKPNASLGEYSAYGWSLAFGRNGKDLAVGAYYEGRGAVLLY